MVSKLEPLIGLWTSEGLQALSPMRASVSGYTWLEKKDLSVIDLQVMRSRLTIQPVKVGQHPGEPPKPIQLFRETEHLVGVPRMWFEENCKSGTVQKQLDTSSGDPGYVSKLAFSGTLREQQEGAVTAIVDDYRAGGLGGMIRAGCGHGKTVDACAIIDRLRVPTIVVVHKEFLLRQWRERIEQFLPGASVGLCQGPILDYEGRDIVIAMGQSLYGREFPVEFLRWPGLFIMDEVHRVGSQTFSQIPGMFPARYRLGISATPRRKDGADNVFYWHIGPIRYTANEKRLNLKVRRVETGFTMVATERFNPSLISKGVLLKFLCANIKRNTLIIEQLIKAVQAGRKVLVMSERLKHLETLENMLAETWPTVSKAPPPTMDWHVGGMSEEELEEAEEAQVIFATYQFCSEALDIAQLDTAFLVTPTGDIEQTAGRILRPHPDKKDPILVDFIDSNVKSCAKYSEYRERTYVKLC